MVLFGIEVKIGARTYKIERRKSDPVLDAHDVRAYTDHLASLIVIRDVEGLSDDAYNEMVMHEVMHAMVKNAGLDQCLKEGFSEEFLVSSLAPRMHALWGDND